MSRPSHAGTSGLAEQHTKEHGRLEQLRRVIDHAAHLLPAQGPIGVFVHHNTLHAFEHLPFEEAVTKAAGIFGTQPYLSEDGYQEERRRGRIRDEDIEQVLAEEPDAEILPGELTRRVLRRVMLVPGVRHFAAENLEWLIQECGLLERPRPDLTPETRTRLFGFAKSTGETAVLHALFAACFDRIPIPVRPRPQVPARPRDGILALTGVDLDDAVHPWLIRLCSVFIDQGLSYWPMPQRDRGFYVAVRDLLGQPVTLEPELLQGLSREFAAQAAAGKSAASVVLDHLRVFQVPDASWEAVLRAELLALPGWAGLMHQLEQSPELTPYEELPCSLIDFLAVRLTLTRVAAENAWRRAEAGGDWRHQWSQPVEAPSPGEPERLALAAELFDVAQLLGISGERIAGLSRQEFGRLHSEVRQFGDWERRRVLHLAYERRHEQLILKPLREHRRTVDLLRPRTRPAAQVMFCLDEREESMRRALEELDPEVETWGAAGFYGVAVNYRGLDDPHGVALCPVVVTPQHAVLEQPLSDEDAALLARRQARRKLWADLARSAFIGSRSLVRGWIGTTLLGLISLVPLVTRVLTPHQAGRFYDWLNERILPQPNTELTLMRQDEAGQSTAEGLLLGFSIAEKVERVASVLQPAGLTHHFARLVVVLGHGATTVNNPHASAYCCGACGGRRGGPNARLFAAMANHPEVRVLLRDRGIHIPEDTWFLGGYHDTCNDDIDLFDTDQIPESHRSDFQRIRRTLDSARAANALERSRRFEAAWRDETPASALRHVQERSEHLAEPRPEYGHGTNAVCIVGRREITRGLFLDRRAFLVSYDPYQDPDNQFLAALLAAGGPVCAGINLEYYFSTVDNERYGSGTKLPHNVIGLVGVVNGAESDLRTGLPRQTVEIHEPVRLLLVVETTPERLVDALGANAQVMQLVQNRWIRVATLDPDDGTVHVYRDGTFELLDGEAIHVPEVPSSAAWYTGKLEHLEIARIRPCASTGL